jgi:hypothetical protein
MLALISFSKTKMQVPSFKVRLSESCTCLTFSVLPSAASFLAQETERDRRGRKLSMTRSSDKPVVIQRDLKRVEGYLWG